MRRRLAAGAAAVSLTVVIAFLVPLLVAVRLVAAQRATSNAQLESQSLAALLASVDDTATVSRVVAEVGARSRNAVTVFLADGELVGDGTAGGTALALAQRGRAFTASVPAGRAVFVPVRGPSGAIAVVRVLVPERELTRGVTTTQVVLGGVAIVLIVLAVLLADRLALSVVRPVASLVDAADRLQRGELDARAEPGGPPEIETVGHALNLLAGRIGDLLTAEREAVADMSHRLRTPLTVLRLDVDQLAKGTARRRLVEDVEDVTVVLDQVIAEARRTGASGSATQCDLVETTRSLVTLWAQLARSQGRGADLVLPSAPVLVQVAPADLNAAIDALITNVFAHTPDGTSFRIAVTEAKGGGGTLTIDDEGPGWPAGFAPRRGRSSRGSTGLGLDIARRTAERSGGELRWTRSPSGGARVELTLGGPPPQAS